MSSAITFYDKPEFRERRLSKMYQSVPKVFEFDRKGYLAKEYNTIGTYGNLSEAETDADHYLRHGYKVLISKANERYYLQVRRIKGKSTK